MGVTDTIAGLSGQELQDMRAKLAAIDRSQAVIEFDLEGTILTANENFLRATGYGLEEIRGQHHRMFVDPAYASSPAYASFWAKLNGGEYETGEYRRLGKGGQEIWIQASYNPVTDAAGRPVKVVKYATDITDRKRAIAETAKIASALADGDLSQEMTGEVSEEFVAVRDALNGSIDNLRSMVSEIRGAAGKITEGASELSQGNADLSGRTQQQAAALEETASTVTEMTSTVRQNAENARQAADLASSARELANKGGSVVGDAISAMGEINESSKKIADIIGVIDGIAFQTNLLALNAAVEAARAGDQGRGFAVVAAEVRNLAQRSASAAKEIKALINDSVDKVMEGTKLVNQSGSTLEEIVTGVKKVSDFVAEISSASQEQATGIEELNKAVSSMDKMTQENAALVEEAVASSTSMDQQARQLAHMVSVFQLHDGDDAAHAVASARQPVLPLPRTRASTSAGRPASAPPSGPASAPSSGQAEGEWAEF